MTSPGAVTLTVLLGLSLVTPAAAEAPGPPAGSVEDRQAEAADTPRYELNEPPESRDADIFGDEGDDEGNHEGEPWPEGDDDTGPNGLIERGFSLVERVEGQEDPLVIGGMLYLRFDYSVLDRGEPEDYPLRSPNLLDLYLDARPNDRVRAYVRGRLKYDYTADDSATDSFGQPINAAEVLLDQLWLKFDVARVAFLTIGQQPIRWGPARVWNPTDFLNRSFREALTLFDERVGLGLVKLHIPVELLGWNFYAIADLDKVKRPDEVGGAFRAEFLIDQTELALSFAARKDTPYRLGASISSGFWLMDIWAELAVLHDVSEPRYSGTFSFDALAATGDALIEAIQDPPVARDISGQWWPRVSAGLEFSIDLGEDDALFIGAEYAFNSLGYDDNALYPWLLINGGFTPLYVGKHYAGAYLLLPAPGRLDDATFTLTTLGNLSDLSFISRFDLRWRVLTYLDINVYTAVHYGENGEFALGYTIPAISDDILSLSQTEFGVDLSAFAGGGELGAPVFDAGIGLRLQL